jgi:hypothetical protein
MLDRLSIAAPCTADWDQMPGTDQVRHCSQCNKNVYNLSAMTRCQAEALLRETEGRLCARLYRRADGTILTENCPAGLRAMGRRISRVAGAAMSAMAALSSAAAVQFPIFPIPSELRKSTSVITGVVEDESGAAIPNANVEIVADSSGSTLTMRTDSFGRFRAESLALGSYAIRIEALGFQPLTRHGSLSRAAAGISLTATLKVGQMTMGVMVIAVNPK